MSLLAWLQSLSWPELLLLGSVVCGIGTAFAVALVRGNKPDEWDGW